MDVREIVKKFLVENGHDGLCMDGCGCGLDSLMSCICNDQGQCVPARKIEVTEENSGAYPEWPFGEEIFVPADVPGEPVGE